jgi:hypothetical protein
MHFASSQATRLATGSSCMAEVGQTATQGASSHCWQTVGMENPSISQEKTLIREVWGRNSPSWWKEHDSAQFWQPVQRSG